MTTQQSQHLGITIPLTTEFRKIAQRFSEQCPFPDKVQQIRRNTLAVGAVHTYLQLMDIPTRLQESDSWNPMMQMVADVADLKVPNLGIIDCRPVSAEAENCYVPPEAWHERAGYIAVVLDEASQRATLLGFARSVEEQSAVSLERFMPIEALLDDVHAQVAAASQQSTVAPSANTVTSLSQSSTEGVIAPYTELKRWIEGAISASWQAADSIINPANLSFAFRSATNVADDPTTANDISRARIIDLGLQLGQFVRVALVIHLTQHPTTPTEANPSTDITVQVRPLGDSPYLPEGLELSIFDERGVALFPSATSRAIDNYLQFQLGGQSGEIFGVRVSTAQATFEEQFVI